MKAIGIVLIFLAICWAIFLYLGMSLEADSGNESITLWDILGVLLSSAFIGALGVACYVGPPESWARNKPKGRCPSCGYDLTGNETGVCPECGVGIQNANH